MVFGLPRVLGEAAHRLWQRIEHFPIPLEDALWIIEAYGDADVSEGILARRDQRNARLLRDWADPPPVLHPP